MVRCKSVAQGEWYWGATYLKGLTCISYFVVRPFSLKWFKQKQGSEMGKGHKLEILILPNII